MTEFLLQTKLRTPNIPAEFVYRPALVAKMDLTLERKLCLISTPAGYGKTTLVVSWANHLRRPLAWVSLDDGDNNFTRFFAYIVAAIQKNAPGFEQGLLEKLTSPQGIPHELFMRFLVNALDQVTDDCILVLDDYHAIHDAEIHESIQYLIDNLPPRLHLVISTRNELPFSIANLRAKAQLIEIQYPELRFSVHEACEYLNQRIGLNLAEKEVRALVEYTEGWIVGLHLAALSLSNKEKTSSLLSQLGLVNQYIAGYLFDEVLRRQPEEIQSFLLQSSVLDRFSAPLCDAALGIESSRALIDSIERSNLFIIPLDNQRQWYRYHHKFSELLYERLKRIDRSLPGQIFQKASSWFKSQGLLEQAIDYAIRAQDYTSAAALMDQIGKNLFWTGDAEQVLNWLDAFPITTYFEHPSLWILHLWAHITLAQFSTVADDLESMRHEKILSYISAEDEKKHFVSSLAEIRALVAINLKYDVANGLRYAELSIENVDQNSVSKIMAPIIYGKACMLSGDLDLAKDILDKSSLEVEKTKSPFMTMIVTHHRSELASFQGDLKRSERLLRAAYKLGIDNHLDNTSAFFRVCIDIGRLNYEWNNLASARQLLTTGVRGGERSLIAYDLLDGYCAIFDLARLERDLAKAEQTIANVEYLGKNNAFPRSILGRAEAMTCRIAVNEGDWHNVREWLDRQDLEKGFAFFQGYEARTAVQALAALKEFDRAEKLLNRLLTAAEQKQWLRDFVRYRAWLASILYQQGNLRSALLVLQKAVRISAYQKYIRSIIDVGDPVIDLLKEIQRRPPPEWEAKSIAEYLPVLINGQSHSSEYDLDGLESAFGKDLVEPLTDREIEVLGLLSKGHSNQEISETMVVSESTVKYHLKNIYLKLGVHTRTQAMIRAQEIQLI